MTRVVFAVVALTVAGCAAPHQLRTTPPFPSPPGVRVDTGQRLERPGARHPSAGGARRDAATGSRSPSPRGPVGSPDAPSPAPGDQGTASAGGSLDGTGFDPDGPVGGYARVLLRPDLSRSIRLQVLIQRGADPDWETLAALQRTLGDLTGKEVLRPEPVPLDGTDDEEWTSARIRQVVNASAPAPPAGEAGIRLAFLTGRFAEDRSVLGVAVSAASAAVFTEQVRKAAGLVGDARRVELAVATHEVGHLLGLVDLVLHTGREDPAHPGHSRNPGSVMYWAVETDVVTTLLEGGPPTTFDAEDRADLAAIRTQEPPDGGPS